MIVDNPRRAQAGGSVGPDDFRPGLNVREVRWSREQPGALEVVGDRTWTVDEAAEIRAFVESTTDVEQAIRVGLAGDLPELRTLIRATGTPVSTRLFARVLLRLALLVLHRVDTPDPDATANSATTGTAAPQPAQQAANRPTGSQ